MVETVRDPSTICDWRISSQILRINSQLLGFNVSVCNWIPREANRTADAATKLALARLGSLEWAMCDDGRIGQCKIFLCYDRDLTCVVNVRFSCVMIGILHV